MKSKRTWKPKNTACPQWILDGVKQIRIAATPPKPPEKATGGKA